VAEVIALLNGDARAIPLADGVVQCAVFSPPYWGLRSYATGNGKHLELGSEKLHDCLGWATGTPCGVCFICQAVAYMREVKRVLRDDGVVFLNIGDSYAGGGIRPAYNNKHSHMLAFERMDSIVPQGLKPKDLCLIPQRLALALQADGWWVRSEIIWYKPNPMPESVTDRPTKCHEQVWLLSKSARYFFDADAVREPSAPATAERDKYDRNQPRSSNLHHGEGYMVQPANTPIKGGRNLRDVWEIPTQSYSGAHYATYPEELVLRCLKAGTSERGACARCGKPWSRVVDVEGETNRQKAERLGAFSAKNPVNQGINCAGGHGNGSNRRRIDNGWQPACTCNADTRPCIVLDPFAGSGTTCLVARRMGLSAVGLDLSYQYLRENAWARIGLSQEAFA